MRTQSALGTYTPQQEQFWLVFRRQTSTTCFAALSALCFKTAKNCPHPASAMARAKGWFWSIPEMLTGYPSAVPHEFLCNDCRGVPRTPWIQTRTPRTRAARPYTQIAQQVLWNSTRRRRFAEHRSSKILLYRTIRRQPGNSGCLYYCLRLFHAAERAITINAC